jgi:hypothetical protein
MDKLIHKKLLKNQKVYLLHSAAFTCSHNNDYLTFFVDGGATLVYRDNLLGFEANTDKFYHLSQIRFVSNNL